MAYQCRQCNRVGSEAGTCPVCNIPMDIRLQDVQPDMAPAEEMTPAVAPEETEKKVPGAAPEMPEVVPAEGDDAEGGEEAAA